LADLLDAFSGLIFCVASWISLLMCDAVGQFPESHLLTGSG
jgi:hypothetical protein